MTSILAEFKRKGGDQLSDWKAPRTSEASKTIITDPLFSFTVLQARSSESLDNWGSKNATH